jgi:3-oxoadipate enol-lactonase
MDPTLGHELFGGGARPVIVLNDWLCDTSTWDGARPYLDVARYTWAFTDLRGYGRSRGRTGAHDVAESAADVLELAERRRWQRFAIVGHSMSAIVALHLAQHHAHRVTRAIAITPPPPAGFTTDEAVLEGPRAFARGDDAMRAAVFAQRFGDRLSPGWAAFKAARWRATADPAAAAAFVAMYALVGLPDRTTRITVPVLAITGERDMELMRAAATTQAWSPRCDQLAVIAIADSGHYPMQETPPLLVAHVERFLAAEP